MTNMKTWLASAVLVGGAGVGGVFGLAAASGPATPTATPPAPRQQGSAGAATLERETSALMVDDRTLRRALARARQRLAGEVASSQHSLAVLRQRVAAREAALAKAQATRVVPAAVMSTSVAPATAPVRHATTGASGAGAGSGGGERDD